MSGKVLLKENLLHLVEQFTDLAKSLNEQQAIERIQPALRLYQIGLFRLVVVGEIKKGKSSLINALLGQHDLLPNPSDVATSTVYKITYGDTRAYKVFFFPKDPEKPAETTPPPLAITQEQLPEYGTEDGNPGNKKGVDFVGVQLPHPLLKSGVMIIDTPGLGGLFKEHSEITWRYVPSADAIFFVFDSLEAMASKTEMDYLQRLRKMTPLLFFVQTKIDLVREEQWQRWRDRNLDIVAQTLEVPKEKLIYFPVSSELKQFADDDHSPKDLNRSGFTVLLYFFHNRLLKAKEERLARVLLQQSSSETIGIRRHVNDELQVFNAESSQALETLERELNETKAKFEKWRATEYQSVMRAFQDESGDLKREMLHALQNELVPSVHGPIICPILEGLRDSNFDPKQLDKAVGAIQSTCISLCNQKIFDIQGQYNHRMSKLIAEILEKLGFRKLDQAHVASDMKGAAVPLVESLNLHFSGYEKARTAFLGCTGGSSMLGALISFVFPPAAAVGVVIGAIGGLLYSLRDMRERLEERAIDRLQGVLADTVSLALKHAAQQFQSTSTALERAARHAFEDGTSTTSKELQARLTSIAEARNRTRKENLAKAAELKKVLTEADQLVRHMGQMLGGAGSPAA